MADEVTKGTTAPHTEHLQDLVLDSSHVEDFLHKLAVLAASELSSPGQEVFCGVTLIPARKLPPSPAAMTTPGPSTKSNTG